MANLPSVIYLYAMSPYENWQTLAWAGALMITLFVLVIERHSALDGRAVRWRPARRAVDSLTTRVGGIVGPGRGPWRGVGRSQFCNNCALSCFPFRAGRHCPMVKSHLKERALCSKPFIRRLQ